MAEIAEQLNEFIRETGLTQQKASELLGISQSFLSQVLNGKRSVDAATGSVIALAMANYKAGLSQSNTTGNALITNIESEGLRRVPVISMARAGNSTDYEDMMNFIEEYTITQTKDPNAFALIVEGDSMEKSYLAGDYIVCSPREEPRNGKPVVARLRESDIPNTGGVLFKRFYRTGTHGQSVRLESDNPNYPPIERLRSDFWFIYPIVTTVRKER